jgi:hypothetical protein
MATNTGSGLRTMLRRTTPRLFAWDLVSFSGKTAKVLLPNSVPELLETHMRKVSPSRMEELIKIFIRATELEIEFWSMGLGSGHQ